MGWTYTGNDKLARAATTLYQRRRLACKLSPLVFMSDPVRTPNVLAVTRNIPHGATVIYRHFGAQNKVEIATKLRKIADEQNLQFLIGQDENLALAVQADGLHIPERLLTDAEQIRSRHPNWLITGAAHSVSAVQLCAHGKCDAAILSTVFSSNSPSAGHAFSVEAFRKICTASDIPIFALGGISTHNVEKLNNSGAAGMAGVSMFSDNHV